jgi:uncharacterized membrane protein YdjX (TVP38/TMEM64 family)
VRKLRIVAALLVVVAVVLLHRLGVLDTFADPETLKATLVKLGPWGHLAFVASYTALQPFGIPGTVFIVAAPLVWPWPVAFALSMVGTMAASVVGFSLARFVGGDWVRDKIPQKIRKYEQALEKRAFTTVVVLRFVLWMPQYLHTFFGVSKISFWTHFWGSLVGYVLPLLVVSYFGEKLFAWFKNAPVELWIGLGAGVVVIAVAVWIATRARATRAATRSSGTVSPSS